MLRPLAAITVLLALAAPQSAAAKPHQIANDVEWYAVDGSRYAAWGSPNAVDSFTVLDTRTHRRRRVKKPVGCSARTGGRTMVDGWMLMECEVATHYETRLVNLRTGRIKRLPGGDDTWVYLGKRWIEGFPNDDYGARAYLNRRTGRIRRFPAPSDLFADPPVRDLDHPKLRLVCIDPGWLNTNDARFYDGGYAVSEPRRGAYRYVLHRTCNAKGRVLDRFGFDQSRPFVDAGSVTWGTRGNAYAVNLATKKRRRWRVPHLTDVGPPEVAQTANTIFFAPPQTDDGTSAPAITSYDLFATHLPGAK
jgi:hypothetical protein